MPALSAPRLLISFAATDEARCQPLLVTLSRLKKDGLVHAIEKQILPDKGLVLASLLQADVIVLVLSKAYLAVPHADLVMTTAMQHQRTYRIRVVPVLLEPCPWKSSAVAALPVQPANGKAISKWNDPNEAWNAVVNHLLPGLQERQPDRGAPTELPKKNSFVPRGDAGADSSEPGMHTKSFEWDEPAACADIDDEWPQAPAAQPVPNLPKVMPPAPQPPAAAAPLQSVLLGASAPQAVKPGQEFTARFAAYIRELEEDVKAKWEKLSPLAQTHMGVKECQWQTGTVVTVRLSGNGLQADPPEDSFSWNGKSCTLDFGVTVLDTAPEETALKFEVLIGGIPVARIRVDLQVTTSVKKEQQQVITAEPIRSAFASYASADRQRVLDRVAEISRNGVDVFLDCMSIKAGEQWQPVLEGEIKKRESFLLFWSANARQSKWVQWEWQTALKERGLSGIEPHPLEDPTVAPPPPELSALHFNDLYMLVRKASAPADKPAE